MNAQEYIESGIIDAYVLGGLSAEENLEVEKYAETYPEIAEEIKQAPIVLLLVSWFSILLINKCF